MGLCHTLLNEGGRHVSNRRGRVMQLAQTQDIQSLQHSRLLQFLAQVHLGIWKSFLRLWSRLWANLPSSILVDLQELLRVDARGWHWLHYVRSAINYMLPWLTCELSRTSLEGSSLPSVILMPGNRSLRTSVNHFPERVKRCETRKRWFLASGFCKQPQALGKIALASSRASCLHKRIRKPTK